MRLLQIIPSGLKQTKKSPCTEPAFQLRGWPGEMLVESREVEEKTWTGVST
ncbi:MAG: hypothetical protein ETSY1_44415 [Candidatus Entotheonella factor]|uniref:Uncharacterized protein n=1 Tax=Entotheonella factor TaxID=1429438 RepID=W4L2E7_ENTF1|nr:MAG: hypothetical protein ETSY1_44415 [Candidatus Entotheonella factor]